MTIQDNTLTLLGYKETIDDKSHVFLVANVPLKATIGDLNRIRAAYKMIFPADIVVLVVYRQGEEFGFFYGPNYAVDHAEKKPLPTFDRFIIIPR